MTLPQAETEWRGGRPGSRLLLVGDNAISPAAVSELRRLGLAVSVASEGRRAVTMAAARCHELILMDMHLPDQDALQTTRRLRGLAPYRNVPIIAVTTRLPAEDRRQSLPAGLNDFLTRPVEPPALRAVLRAWLPPHAPARAALPVSGRRENADTDWRQRLASIPGLDIGLGLELVSGNEAIYLKWLKILVDYHGPDPQRLRDCLAAADLTGLGRLAHSLKGAAGHFGAWKVQAMASDLDRAIQHKASLMEIETLTAALVTELAELISAVRTRLPLEDPPFSI